MTPRERGGYRAVMARKLRIQYPRGELSLSCIRKMSVNGKLIARRMHALKVEMIALGMPEQVAEESAFHMADMEADLLELLLVLRQAARGRRLKASDICHLSEILDSHTQYHFTRLRRALRRAVASISPDST